MGCIVGGLLDRFAEDPGEPVVDRLLENVVVLGRCLDLVALLTADPHNHSFSWNLSRSLLTQLLKFLQGDNVQPTNHPNPGVSAVNYFGQYYDTGSFPNLSAMSSRRLYFWTFPLGVRGKSEVKTICSG